MCKPQRPVSWDPSFNSRRHQRVGVSSLRAERIIRFPSCLLEAAMEARTEAESTLYRHLHRSSYTALLFKIEVSSVKTCGLIASTPLMVCLSLSIRPAPSAWGYYFVNFQGSHICRSSRHRGSISTNIYIPRACWGELAEPLLPSKHGQICVAAPWHVRGENFLNLKLLR